MQESIYAVVFGAITTWIVQNFKEVDKARKTGDWSPVYKRGAALVAAIVCASFMPPVVQLESEILSKIVTVMTVSALASDYIYQAAKRLKGEETQPEPDIENPFESEVV